MSTDTTKNYKKSTIIAEGADLKKSDPKSHYVDNEKFYAAMVARRLEVDKAKAEGLPLPRVSEFIGKCILNIAEKLSTKHYFCKYPFREDMVSEATIHMTKYVDSFDVYHPSKYTDKEGVVHEKTPSPFSYMTQTAYYSFINSIGKEKHELAQKFKIMLEAIATQQTSCADDPDYHTLIAEENLPDVGFMSDYVKEYEESLADKKKEKEKKEAAKRIGLDIGDIDL